MELPSDPCPEPTVWRMAIRIFKSIVTPIDFKGWGSQWSQTCVRERKNCEMNKCLSLVHLTSGIGSQSSGSDESAPWSCRYPKPDLDPPRTKSIAGRLTLIAAAPSSALRLNLSAGKHLPRTPQLRLSLRELNPISNPAICRRLHYSRDRIARERLPPAPWNLTILRHTSSMEMRTAIRTWEPLHRRAGCSCRLDSFRHIGRTQMQ